jgi:hypothetical protein
MLSPNARYFTRWIVGIRDTVTLNEHVPVRLNESVAVQVTEVVPIGKFPPDSGVQLTLTVPCPAVAVGVSKLTDRPVALAVARDTPSTQVTEGASATGGGSGGCGVGAAGVLLHAENISDEAITIASPQRVAQYFTIVINVN